MKLKPNFLTQRIDGVQYLVPIGGEAFSGIARSNAAAAFIVDMLESGTDEAAIVDAMCLEYDAPREVLAADVKEILAKLRSIGAIEE
jgi:hypothetical protein